MLRLAVAGANYRVIQHGDGSFAVEVTRAGAMPHLVDGFATGADAEAWILQDQRLWEAADPFRTPASRKRHRS